jgi:hypothetical protein
MPKRKLYVLPEFTFWRQSNGGILIEDPSMESLRLGLMPSQFLIHVEYRNKISADINIEVIHKKSVTEIIKFFEANRNYILKYFCKNETDFESYVKEQKQFIATERYRQRKILWASMESAESALSLEFYSTRIR